MRLSLWSLTSLDESAFQLKGWYTPDLAGPAWCAFGEIVLCPDEETMLACSDHVAAEQLQVHTRDAHATAKLSAYRRPGRRSGIGL